MNWTTENVKDAAILKLLDLDLLDAAWAGGDEPVAGRIGENNSKLIGLTERFIALAADRAKLADCDNWLDCDSASIAAQRTRVEQESWNSLVALRSFLVERRSILDDLFIAAGERVGELNARYDAIRQRTCKALDREHRKMLVATPATAGMHFADLVNSNPEVATACQEIAPAQAILERVQTARLKARTDMGTVKARQREVFTLIAA